MRIRDCETLPGAARESAPCPGCRQPLRLHSRSGRTLVGAANGIGVANGRCYPGGAKAPQKLSWVAMSENLTEEEYREHYSEAPPPMEPCPGCGGPLGYHGSFARHLIGADGELQLLILHRGICRNPVCPVVTVSHYPEFVTPYSVYPTAVREEAIRQSVLGKGLEAIGASLRCTGRSILRWRQSLKVRLPELIAGVARLIMRWDANWRLPAPQGEEILAALDLCAKAREFRYPGHRPALLSIPRQRPSWPSALPVFV